MESKGLECIFYCSRMKGTCTYISCFPSPSFLPVGKPRTHLNMGSAPPCGSCNQNEPLLLRASSMVYLGIIQFMDFAGSSELAHTGLGTVPNTIILTGRRIPSCSFIQTCVFLVLPLLSSTSWARTSLVARPFRSTAAELCTGRKGWMGSGEWGVGVFATLFLRPGVIEGIFLPQPVSLSIFVPFS